MATYPLKNISIGGNTYQINGSDKYHCMIMGPSVSDLVTIYQFNNTNISTGYLSVIKNFTVVSNPGETLLDMINNDEQCVHLNYGAYPASDLYLKSAEFTGISEDPIDFYFESEVYEDNGTAYVSQVVIRVSGTSPFSIISITGKKIACGGGGGGGASTTILGLYDPNQGNLVDLNSLSQSMTVEVWDITDMANPVPLDDTAFLAKIQAGQCYFKDSRNNTYSVVYDATAHNIGVIFNAAGVPYFVSINYQWNNNWNIIVLKTITLH